MNLSRSLLFAFCLIGALLFPATSEAQLFKKKKKETAFQSKLQPGQFEWKPELAPAGPLLIVVSIDDQAVYVYRNGRQIGRSTVSTGKPGKETPTGVFTILQKNKDHESNIYKGAKMPYMQRLTWSGIAIHAGDLPGYPASAGCVRLPLEFSRLLFGATTNGSTVVITKYNAIPSSSAKPAEVLLATQVDAASKPIPAGKGFWNPGKSPEGPVGLLLSTADRTMYVYRNGILIGQSPVYLPPAKGTETAGVFLMLEGTVEGDNPIVKRRPMRPWAVLSLESQPGEYHPVSDLRSRLRLPDDFAKNVYDLLTPGALLIVTPKSSTAQTRSGTDFVIMNPASPPAP